MNLFFTPCRRVKVLRNLLRLVGSRPWQLFKALTKLGGLKMLFVEGMV